MVAKDERASQSVQVKHTTELLREYLEHESGKGKFAATTNGNILEIVFSPEKADGNHLKQVLDAVNVTMAPAKGNITYPDGVPTLTLVVNVRDQEIAVSSAMELIVSTFVNPTIDSYHKNGVALKEAVTRAIGSEVADDALITYTRLVRRVENVMEPESWRAYVDRQEQRRNGPQKPRL
jgi:hypothetical protein